MASAHRKKLNPPPPSPSQEALSAREEMLVLLFRGLSGHQQREEIIKMRALFDANSIARRQLKGKSLRAASNEAVRAAFKDVPPPSAKKRAKKKPGRDLGDAMGDYLDE